MSELPAFAVIYGPRALLSFIGISTIVSGTWKAENIFDEQGVKAFENANAAGLEPVTHFKELSSINKEELDSACPIPWLTLAGWIILAVSCFVPHQIPLASFQIDFTLAASIAAVCCLTLGFLVAWPIREAYNERDITSMVQNYQLAATFAIVLVGSVIAGNAKGPFWLGPIGSKLQTKDIDKIVRTMMVALTCPFFFSCSLFFVIIISIKLKPCSRPCLCTHFGNIAKWENLGCETDVPTGPILSAMVVEICSYLAGFFSGFPSRPFLAMPLLPLMCLRYQFTLL